MSSDSDEMMDDDSMSIDLSDVFGTTTAVPTQKTVSPGSNPDTRDLDRRIEDELFIADEDVEPVASRHHKGSRATKTIPPNSISKGKKKQPAKPKQPTSVPSAKAARHPHAPAAVTIGDDPDAVKKRAQGKQGKFSWIGEGRAYPVKEDGLSKNRKQMATDKTSADGSTRTPKPAPVMTEYAGLHMSFVLPTGEGREQELHNKDFVHFVWEKKGTHEPVDGGIYQINLCVQNGVGKGKEFRVRECVLLKEVAEVPIYVERTTKIGEDVLIATQQCFIVKQRLFQWARKEFVRVGREPVADDGAKYYFRADDYATARIEDDKSVTYTYLDPSTIPKGVHRKVHFANNYFTTPSAGSYFRHESEWKPGKNNLLVPPEGCEGIGKDGSEWKPGKPPRKKMATATIVHAPAPHAPKPGEDAKEDEDEDADADAEQRKERRRHHHRRRLHDGEAKTGVAPASKVRKEDRPKEKEKKCAKPEGRTGGGGMGTVDSDGLVLALLRGTVENLDLATAPTQAQIRTILLAAVALMARLST